MQLVLFSPLPPHKVLGIRTQQVCGFADAVTCVQELAEPLMPQLQKLVECLNFSHHAIYAISVI